MTLSPELIFIIIHRNNHIGRSHRDPEEKVYWYLKRMSLASSWLETTDGIRVINRHPVQHEQREP